MPNLYDEFVSLVPKKRRTTVGDVQNSRQPLGEEIHAEAV
jgi:hypothetical protein